LAVRSVPVRAVSLLASRELRQRDNPEFALAVAETLEQLIEHDDLSQVNGRSVASLLAMLNLHVDTLGEQRVAKIEWWWLPELDWSAETPCLHKAIAQDPNFFGGVPSLV